MLAVAEHLDAYWVEFCHPHPQYCGADTVDGDAADVGHVPRCSPAPTGYVVGAYAGDIAVLAVVLPLQKKNLDTQVDLNHLDCGAVQPLG